MKNQDFTVFRGGVHPTNGYDKALSNAKPITEYTPKVVEISMAQTGPSICECLVKAGDHVEKGQLIGSPANFFAVKLHASVSGTVKEIKMVPNGPREIPVCVIEVDEVQPPVEDKPYRHQLMDLSEYTKEQLVGMMEDAGITGMGGAGFPSHVKFKPKDPIKYVLINAAECEPFLTCDHRMLLEHSWEILNGVNAMIKAAGAAKGYICMEDNKQDVADHLNGLLQGCDVPFEVKVLPTKYPQGGERQLILAVTGQEIPAGGLPASVGCIVANTQSAKAMGDMVFAGIPSISRCITITGLVGDPKNFLVPLGTPIRELVALAGGITEKNNKVILGGPMTGPCIGTEMTGDDIDKCVTKVNGGLLVLENDTLVESNCIRCGGCVEVCPAGLHPFKIDQAFRAGKLDLCEALYATECIACGCCSYTCPAKRELTFYNTKARDAVKAAIRERSMKK